MKYVFTIRQYLHYWLRAVNEHALHSPFLFEFYTKVVKADNKVGFEEIEARRKAYKKSEEVIAFKELGAGSKSINTQHRKVSAITKAAVTPARFSRLIYRIIQHFDYQVCIELGTCLGINTLYMHAAQPQAQIFTFEGSPGVAELARQQFDQLDQHHIQLVEGNIDHTLKDTLANISKVDFAYVDANHRYAPSLDYFEQLLPKMAEDGMIILDDIHWSPGMSRVWKEICQRPEVSLSLDLFEGGILFFKPGLKKAHYILSF